MISRNIFLTPILLIAASLLAGCSLSTTPPVVDQIIAVPNTTQIQTGNTVTLQLNAQGTDIEFEWTVDRGMLSNNSKAAVVYTAPDSPGADIVTVKVKTKGGEVTRSISFDVVAPPPPTATEVPPPTDTPTSTAVPTLTAAPSPIACNHPSVTSNLFPQFKDVIGQFSMYGPVDDSNILCEAVYDLVHTPGGMAVHIKYQNIGTNAGWWGFGIKNPDSFDASVHRQLCFWAYAKQPNQSFHFKMKDKNGNEKGIIAIIDKANEWQQICADITKFSSLGVLVNKMENINLGFEQPTGSAEVWVADFEFK